MTGKQVGLAFGAGAASALLFVVSAKGTVLASLMAYLTALPLIIAALGFGHVTGLGAALVGFGGVALATSPVLGLFFLVCFALPGWWLAYLLLLARPGGPPPAAAAFGVSRPAPLIWYPIGRLATWIAAIAAGAVLLIGAAAVLRFGGYEQAAARLAARLGEVMGPAAGDQTDAGRMMAQILPVALAASLVPMLGLNLWLGARIAQASQRLRRPWPNVPDGLRLPSAAAGVFILSLGPALLPGPPGIVAGTIAGAFGITFAFQGLAAAHVLTRGFTARRAVLALIYSVTVLMPLAVIALAVIGVLDSLFSLRNRRAPAAKP